MIQLISCIAAACSLSLAVAPAPSQAPAPGKPAVDPGATGESWPQHVSAGGSSYQVFRPRLTGLDGSRAYFVAEVAIQGGTGAPKVGEATLSADVMASDVPGEVEINRFRVNSFTVNGAPATADETTALSQALYLVALTSDRATLVRSLKLVNPRASSTPGLRHDAPAIVVVQKPTVLVSVDGEPRLAPLGSTGWSTVRNTPAVLLRSPEGEWCVRISGAWKRSKSLAGGYSDGAAPPKPVVDAMGTAPAMPTAISTTKPASTPPAPKPADVMVATAPTVLVALDGAPRLERVTDGVQRVSNTPAMLLTTDGSAFFLLSGGRWFSTASLGSGAWSAVSPGDLPPAFAQIPSSRRMDAVRAAVSGTPEANEAVVAAREIRTVTLRREGAAPRMTVEGSAEWTPIASGGGGSDVSWLVNASKPTVRAGGLVYCCDDGAWFEAPNETGPWTLCDRVPDAVYGIPPSSPVYPCTYVWVMGSTTDSVTFGFSPGYLGTYVNDGTPVYGTGFAYPQPSAEGYDAYPQTYGCDPTYDAQSGTFAPPAASGGDVPYWGTPDVYPAYLAGDGWGGWGWCGGWNQAWGWGWGGWWGWNHWPWWANHWHPYYDRWNDLHHDWQRANARDARQRLAQHGKAVDARTWAAPRGEMADAGRAEMRKATDAAAAPRRDASEAAARENEQAMQRRFEGAAQDAPAAFRGPGNEYGGYDASAYRPWTGTGSMYGGNWGYEPLARPNGFHPPQQFAAPGAYWGTSRGVNAGPYATPAGFGAHGGWGTYDHWAGEGINDTQWGRRDDDRRK
jgi:hypothetical protein